MRKLLAAFLPIGVLVTVSVAATQPPSPPPSPAPSPSPSPWDVTRPPGPAQDVALDVDEGTWMNLDVSPDGREIVFDLLGDIYLLPIGGGEAKPLTSGHRLGHAAALLARTASASRSPPTAAGGDNLWVMDRDGAGATAGDARRRSGSSTAPPGRPTASTWRRASTSPRRRSLGAGEIWLYHRSRRRGPADHQAPQRPEGRGRARLLAGRPLPLLQPGRHAGRGVRVQQGRPRRDLRDPAAGPRDGRDRSAS